MKTIVLVFALLAGAVALRAANVLTGDAVRIKTPVEGNVYAAAGSITIEAVVKGDVNAVSGELRVLDTIRGDLVAGGGRIRVEGVVGQDLRCGGGETLLSGHVLGDVVVGAGQLDIARDAVIHGDLVVAGGQVQVYGHVMGSVILAGGEVLFEGAADQDAEIRGGRVELNGVFRGPCRVAAETLRLGPNAAFYQEVRYWQKDGELNFSGHLRERAQARFDESLQQDMKTYRRDWYAPGFSFFSIYTFLAGALLVTLLALLFGAFFRRAAQALPAEWLPNFGLGILYLIGTPVAVLLLLVTVIGIPFGIFLLLFYGFTLLCTKALTALVAASAWEHYRKLNWTVSQRILVAVAFLLALRLLSLIPVLGWLALAVAGGVALGSVAKAVWYKGV